MRPVIFHIDVNSAYLSWTAVEELKNGAEKDLRKIPSIIGGNQKERHGVVLAKSIPAKRYGVRTGEPVANALKKCPKLVIKPPDHRMYSEYSERVMAFLREYTPDLEQVSIDECYMDFTGIAHRFHSPVDAALEMKNKIYSMYGFTVNIGISSNKLLAKMASDFEKPNKVHTLFPEEIEVKMWPLPVSELYMAGQSSVAVMQKLEIKTIGELAQADPEILELHLKSHGRMLWEFANGIDESKVQSEDTDMKGIGNSVTLPRDLRSMEDVRPVLRDLADKVSERLRKAGKKAGVVNVEIKYSDFKTSSHQTQLLKPSNTNDMIYRTAVSLFSDLWSGRPVRLLGIRTSKLVQEGEPEQLTIFDFQPEETDDEKHRKLDKALDEIKKRYGKDAVKRGSRLS